MWLGAEEVRAHHVVWCMLDLLLDRNCSVLGGGSVSARSTRADEALNREGAVEHKRSEQNSQHRLIVCFNLDPPPQFIRYHRIANKYLLIIYLNSTALIGRLVVQGYGSFLGFTIVKLEATSK